MGLENYVTPHFLFRPTKARKNHPLTPTQRIYNAALASVRVCVEHTIAKAKAFFSLRIENRLKQKAKLDDAVAICSGLADFKNKVLVLWLSITSSSIIYMKLIR